MTTNTDLITIVAFILFFYLGWRKGFLRSIMGPISLIIGSIVSIQYYYKTQDIVMSLVIGILGPFVINIVLTLLLKAWKLSLGENPEMPVASRIFGGCFSIVWRGTMFLLMILLICFLPSSTPLLGKIQADASGSRTFLTINHFFQRANPEKAVSITSFTDLLKDPEKLEGLRETEEFADLTEDQTFRELFSDKEFLEAAENQDFGKLLTHPNMQKILTDKNLVQKFMAFQKQLVEEGFKEVDTE